MNLRKKVKIALAFLIVCLVLLISASYAWIALSARPEVTNIDTNVGANGSLEIALLSDKTYADPVLIRTGVGDSAVEQDSLESNQHWGNVIELADARYGLGQISLLPARLNLLADENGICYVGRNLLKVANFGIDGRMTILSEETVSAIMAGDTFTYYTDSQSYGVRAIGTISNLTAQQIALASSRTMVKSHTAAAARTLKHAWRDNGSAIMDILFDRYSAGSDSFAAKDVTAIRNLANGLLESLNYVDAALRQGIIGVAATQIADQTEFETVCEVMNDTSIPLSGIITSLGDSAPEGFLTWATQLDRMKLELQGVVAVSLRLAGGAGWTEIEAMLDLMLDAEQAYLGEELLASQTAFESMTGADVITLSPDSGVMAKIAAYAGNYSAFSAWNDTGSVELRTADPNDPAYLIRIEKILENSKAVTGGWTRANLNDTFGFAVDLAFRCNRESELLLQTAATLRVNENSEFPVTQGSGSYMRFSSENMDTEQLLQLMDTIRVGFLSDRNELLAIAKLGITNYEEQEEGILAPLYLYDYSLEEDGSLTVGARRSEDASILSLPQSSPKVVTVIVWLDGDYVDNSMVSDTAHQSMTGVLNLQFSSSADLLPTDVTIKSSK